MEESTWEKSFEEMIQFIRGDADARILYFETELYLP